MLAPCGENHNVSLFTSASLLLLSVRLTSFSSGWVTPLQLSYGFLMSSDLIFTLFHHLVGCHLFAASSRIVMCILALGFQHQTISVEPSLVSKYELLHFFDLMIAIDRSVFTASVDIDPLLHSDRQLQTLYHWFSPAHFVLCLLGLLVHRASCHSIPHLLLLLSLSHEHILVCAYEVF